MSAKSRALAPGLLGAIFSIFLLHTAWVKSPTWDEVGHIGLGAYLLKTGRWDVPASCSHPPLAFYLHSPPSFAYPLDWGRWRYSTDKVRDIEFLRSADTKRGNAMLLDGRYDGERFFFWTRATSLLLVVPLFWALYSWSRELSGYPGALLTLLFAALSPNLLAHATLINTDFVLAATFFCAACAYRRLLLYPSRATLLVAGLALGLALMSKLSALILLPVLLATTSWFWRFSQPQQRQNLAQLFGTKKPIGLGAAYLTVCSLALFVLWAGYGFRYAPYVLTIRSQLWDVGVGHSAYLMGQFSIQGWWYYFPLAMLIKTPLPTFALAAWGLGEALGRAGQFEESVEMLDMALRLSPRDPLRFLFFVFKGRSHAGLSQNEAAEAAYREATANNCNIAIIMPHLVLVDFLVRQDRLEDGRAVMAELLQSRPGLTLADAILAVKGGRRSFVASGWRQNFITAGLPE